MEVQSTLLLTNDVNASADFDFGVSRRKESCPNRNRIHLRRQWDGSWDRPKGQHALGITKATTRKPAMLFSSTRQMVMSSLVALLLMHLVWTRSAAALVQNQPLPRIPSCRRPGPLLDSSPYGISRRTQPRQRKSATTTTGTTSSTRLFAIWNKPKPPSTPPPLEVWQQVVSEQEASAKSVQQLEEQLADLQRELALKQVEMEQQSDTFSREKTGLLAKLTEFTLLASQRSDDDEANQETTDRLQRELDLLQEQLPLVQNALRTEQLKSYELSEKLADLDYTLEYQQMEFDKAQGELQQQLQAAQDALSAVQGEWSSQQQNLSKQSDSAVQELQDELQRVNEARQALQANQEAFVLEQERLQKSLSEQTMRLEQSQEQVRLAATTSQADKAALQRDIAAERKKVEQAERFLQEAQGVFTKMEAELQQQLRSEEEKVTSLTEKLKREQDIVANSNVSLKERLQAEEGRVQQLTSQLQAERLQANKDQRRLEELWKEEIRLRKVKKAHMNSRYEEIRKEMTNLWQGALRDGRQQVAALTNKYTSQMQALQDTVTQLQADIASATSDQQRLQVLLDDMTRQKEEAIQSQQASEARYQAALASKNQEIDRLQSNVVQLQGQLTERDRELASMRTSIRKLLSETATLTARKLIVRPVKFLVHQTPWGRRSEEKAAK